MKERRNHIITLIAEIAIMSALGYVLDELGSGLFKGVFPNGGSITIAMLAVFVIGYRRGFVPALITGFIMGSIDAITGPYIIGTNVWSAIAQLFLDYLAAYAFASLGTLFVILFKKAKTKKDKVLWIIVGCVTGGLCKLLAHYLSGIIFWANPNDFAWGLNTMSPYLYSLLYNGAFVVPSMILSTSIMVIFYLTVPQVFLEKKIEKEEK